MVIHTCTNCKREVETLFHCDIWCYCKKRVKNKMLYKPTKEELKLEMEINNKYTQW